jgi:TRAP-type uncharacterized transport system substrate-binding protein
MTITSLVNYKIFVWNQYHILFLSIYMNIYTLQNSILDQISQTLLIELVKNIFVITTNISNAEAYKFIHTYHHHTYQLT